MSDTSRATSAAVPDRRLETVHDRRRRVIEVHRCLTDLRMEPNTHAHVNRPVHLHTRLCRSFSLPCSHSAPRLTLYTLHILPTLAVAHPHPAPSYALSVSCTSRALAPSRPPASCHVGDTYSQGQGKCQLTVGLWVPPMAYDTVSSSFFTPHFIVVHL